MARQSLLWMVLAIAVLGSQVAQSIDDATVDTWTLQSSMQYAAQDFLELDSDAGSWLFDSQAIESTRQLQQLPEALNVTEQTHAIAIRDATAYGNLNANQQAALRDEYMAALGSLSLGQWNNKIPCVGSFLLNGISYGGVLFENCVDSQVVITGNVTITSALIYNNLNTASQRAIFNVTPGSHLTISNAVFLGNTATSGVLYAGNGATIDAGGVVFHGNQQRVVPDAKGQPQLIQAPLNMDRACLTSLTLSTFVGNGQTVSGDANINFGGAIRQWGPIVNDPDLLLVNTFSCDVVMDNNTFLSNLASNAGGAVDIFNVDSATITNNIFRLNKAGDCKDEFDALGGGLWMGGSHTAVLQNNVWQGNRACFEGGAASISTDATVVHQESFTDNYVLAGNGGGLLYRGTNIKMNFAHFSNNTALKGLGGGFHCAGCAAIAMFNSEFTANVAGSGGASVMQASSVINVTNTKFMNNNASMYQPGASGCDLSTVGTGGAVCLDMIKPGGLEAYDAPYVANFTDCTFTDNSATVGGGVYHFTKCPANQQDLLCAKLRFAGNMHVEGNSAVGGTGDFAWISEPEFLTSACPNNAPVNEFGFCDVWTTMNGQPEDETPVIASAATNLTVIATVKNQTLIPVQNGNVTIWPSLSYPLASSTLVPFWLDFQVLLQDGFSNSVLKGSADSQTKVTAYINNNGTFIGSSVVAAQDGVADFADLALKAQPGTYVLTFAAVNAGGSLINTSVKVTVRPCRVGEVAPTSDLCNPCRDSNQFSFDPSSEICDFCPDSADCSYPGKNTEEQPSGPIGAVLVPVSGYWHSSPRSSQVHLCPHPASCSGNIKTGTDLHNAIAAFQKQLVLDGTSLQDILQYNLSAYSQWQCQEGHYGNVCGGCADGFGRRDEGECIRCAKTSVNSFILFLAIFVRLALVCLTISSQLQAFTDFDSPSLNRGAGEKTGRSDKLNSDSLAAPSTVLTHEQRVERTFTPDTTAIKILINYLQITAILRGVTLQLPQSVIRLLQAAGFVSHGVQSWISIDCSLYNTSVRKSVQATILTVLMPFMLFVGTIPFWAAWWTVRYGRNADVRFWPYMRSRLIITTLALGFYFYPQLTDSILSVFNCRQLDVDNGKQGELLTAVGKWWTADYNQKCYEGQHFYLLMGLGIPGIVLICIGLPVFSYIFLRIKRSKHKTPGFASKYALMYADYDERWYFWESAVMIRKFGLVILSVTINSSVPVLKLLACLIWVEAWAIAAVIARPFRLARMDYLDRVGHWGNGITIILLALFFIQPDNDPLRTFATAVLLIINVVIIVYMVLKIIQESLCGLMVELDSTARGYLKESDFLSLPHTDQVVKLKMRFVQTTLGVLERMPDSFARWVVIYPCEMFPNCGLADACTSKNATRKKLQQLPDFGSKALNLAPADSTPIEDRHTTSIIDYTTVTAHVSPARPVHNDNPALLQPRPPNFSAFPPQ